ncbi:Jacalin-like lectin domain protein [Fusarium sp. NRRL 52700]|nr:Jacalin-like lectin domain protein [Fusarium sp. NRRL 52700]
MNLSAGKTGGDKLKHQNVDNLVKKIEVWGNPDSVEAIRVTYGDSDTQKDLGYPGDDNPKVIILGKRDRITEFSAWSGPFVRKLSIKTFSGQQIIVGDAPDNDDRLDMEVGSGFLAGLEVSADAAKIYRLKPLFLNKVKVTRTNNKARGNWKDHQPTWNEVTLDTRVEKVQMWWRTTLNKNDLVCRAIQVTWEGGEITSIVGITDNTTFDAMYTFDLANGETVTKSYMRTGAKVDQFSIETSKNTKHTWGASPGGYFYNVEELGDGILIGFEGASGNNQLLSLAPVFAKV